MEVTRVRLICVVISGLMSLVATMVACIVKPELVNSLGLLLGFAVLWVILEQRWYAFLKTDT